MEYPRIFALIFEPSNEVKYTSVRITEVQSIRKTIPADFRNDFKIVRYDASRLYNENNQNERIKKW